MKILVLGLGNDIIADDAVGIEVARLLRDELPGHVDIEETAQSGLSLLEFFIGYDKAVVIDAIKTGAVEPGTIREWIPEDLDALEAPSPHYTGMPELLALAKHLELDYPEEIKILSMETLDPYTIGGEMTQPVKDAIPAFVEAVKNQVFEWEGLVCEV